MLRLAAALLLALVGPVVAPARPALDAPLTDPRPGAASPGLARFVEAAGQCPSGVAHCVGISLHVVVDGGTPVREASWFARQVEVANHHFDALGVGFQVVEVDALPASDAAVETREHRDTIGASRVRAGLVHVFLVARLADVDADGVEIRGVHWRLRRDTARRWILLSAIAGELVLAHELGHFFGLPHSGYPISIMNKRPRASPPPHRRSFHAEELRAMRGRLPALLGPSGDLDATAVAP